MAEIDNNGTEERLKQVDQDSQITSILESSKPIRSAFSKDLEEEFKGFHLSGLNHIFRAALTFIMIINACFFFVSFYIVKMTTGILDGSNLGLVLAFFSVTLLMYSASYLTGLKRPSYALIHLLIIVSALIFSKLATTSSLFISSSAVIFLLMLSYSVILILMQVTRVHTCVLGFLIFLLFNSNVYLKIPSLLKSPESLTPYFFDNMIILGMVFLTLLINSIQESKNRKLFLELYKNKLATPSSFSQEFKASVVPINQATNQNLTVLGKKALISIDPSLGVANSKSFMRYFEQEWKTAFNARQCLAVMLIDLGEPPFEDKDSAEAKGVVMGACEEMKRFARRGGDLVGCYQNNTTQQFAVLLGDTNLTSAKKLAERLIDHLKVIYAPYRAKFEITQEQIENPELNFGINIGVASTLPMPGMEYNDLLLKAEQALSDAPNRNHRKNDAIHKENRLSKF